MLKLRTILLCDKLYLCLSLIAVIYSFLNLNYYPHHSKCEITNNCFVGYLHSYKIDGSKLTITLKADETIIVNYYFKSKDEKEHFPYKLGDYIKIKGVLRKPSTSTIPNLFNYQKYLAHKQIFFLLDAEEITYVKKNTRLRYYLKQFIIDHIDHIGRSSTYVKALVIGDDDGFNDDIMKSYQFNGVSHLFAISGSHISFLACIILWFLKKLKVEENKRYYIVICFLLFYMFLTDYAGSVLRAVIFFALLAINKMYYFHIKTINILQLTLFLLLITNPSLLYDVGFQFSFMISLYLIVYQNMISKTKHYFSQTFLISWIAFLVSIPICINNFSQINLLSPIINLFFVPYVSFILFPLAFICLICPFFDSVLLFFINILEYLSLLFSNLKIGEIILAKPSLIIIILYYFVISLSLKGMSKQNYRSFVILFLMLFTHYHFNYFNRYPYLMFLDVGQGDAIFINLPHNQGNILIDTGGKMLYQKEPWEEKMHKYNIGEDKIIPYLKSIGVTHLDYLFLTHGDEDHMGESESIVSNFKVDKVILNGGTNTKIEEGLIQTLKILKIEYNFGKKGDVISVGQYRFYILNPSENINENDNSLVIYIKLLNNNVLLTGDISTKIEEQIVSAYSNLKVDILKLGHHGSITSTSELFLDTLKPKYAVIEVGQNNRFNHPSKIVLQRLRDRRIKIFQTSIDGSIMFIIRANDVTIKSYST